MMIRLEHVSKTYGTTQILQPLSLHIAEGETVVVIGPSGCGKSTLLRILMGLIPADSGQVVIDGTPLRDDNALHMRHKMGYVQQDGGLFPHLTGRRNATLLAHHLRVAPPEWIGRRVELLARLTKLPVELLERYPAQLSGGQRQRVALMRALMLDPPLLLLDEPLGALDPLVRYELQEDLREIFVSLRKTVVLVTHDMAEAAFFGGQVLLMHAGRIVQRGSIEDFLRRPAEPFVRQFMAAQRFLPSPDTFDDL